MTNYPIYDMRPELIPNAANEVAKRKYPFKELECGKCFVIMKHEEKKLKTFKQLCLYWNKKLPAKFQAVLDQDGNIVVWRKS